MTYNAASGTVVIGSGLTWSAVYQRLQEHRVNVVGGRVAAVSRRGSLGLGILDHVTQQIGVGGLLLGGGMSLEVLRRFVH